MPKLNEWIKSHKRYPDQLAEALKKGYITIIISLQLHESGCGAIGSALALGARGCQFESGHPDHFLHNLHKKIALCCPHPIHFLLIKSSSSNKLSSFCKKELTS